jgi:adenine phosphoribosyltransferase
VSDFPTEGIAFADLQSILADPTDLNWLLRHTSDSLKKLNVYPGADKVICAEARGFLLGTHIAKELNAGLILARKPGKLPPPVSFISYDTEYSEDLIEIEHGIIKEGDRVLIHDDILATGGTAKALAGLVESSGGIVVGFHFIMDIGIIDPNTLKDGKVVFTL